MNTQCTINGIQRAPADITPADITPTTFAFDLLFNAAQSIHRAHETTPSTYALPLWKTHVSYLLTAITHGANELAHTELPSLLTLQQDVNNLVLHINSLLAPTFNNPLPTPPTPSTPRPRTTPPTPHLKHIPNRSIRVTPKKPELRLHWVPNRPETPPRTPSPQPTPPHAASPTPTHHSVDSVDTVEFLLEPPLYDHPIGPLKKPLYDHPAGPMEGPLYNQPTGPMEGPIYPLPAGPEPWVSDFYAPPHHFIPTHSVTYQVNNVLRRPSLTCDPFDTFNLSMEWYEALRNTMFWYRLHRANVHNQERFNFSNFNWVQPQTTKIRSSIHISFCDDNTDIILNNVIETISGIQHTACKRDVFNPQISYEIVDDTPILTASTSAS
ncbi:hypothetical protein WOLCODRAFT_158381 [Wolfiporia cocos MD-104 SS10]|uniref:Uncharacterized protein n=1 Tax=Wolfiporia cocos (strain MD-104) TaxID=742152 RepID=A0A2H3JG76_WOLCO|nr:hypothetical protein WOLCODRAFT_158381 [Wolfiporia cocos MD-104 SS10]